MGAAIRRKGVPSETAKKEKKRKSMIKKEKRKGGAASGFGRGAPGPCSRTSLHQDEKERIFGVGGKEWKTIT